MKTNNMIIANDVTLFQDIITDMNNNGNAIFMTDNTEIAIEKFQQDHFNTIFLYHDVDLADKRKLQKVFTLLNEDVDIVEINAADNIKDVITGTLQKRKMSNYSFVDDALANAKFNIHIEE